VELITGPTIGKALPDRTGKAIGKTLKVHPGQGHRLSFEGKTWNPPGCLTGSPRQGRSLTLGFLVELITGPTIGKALPDRTGKAIG